MSDTVIGALIGAGGTILGILISIFSQFLFYFLEKQKLQKEREFSFRKEEYFKLQEKAELIHEYLSKINSHILDKNNLKNGKFKDLYSHFESLEALIRIYFNSCYHYYNDYMTNISESFETNPKFRKEADSESPTAFNKLVACIRETLEKNKPN